MKVCLGLIFGFALSASAFGSDLDLLLKKKSKNYSTVTAYYRKLSGFADRNQQKNFCAALPAMKAVFAQILTDDQALITELYAEKDQDSADYAKHLDENSLSDLFAYNIHLERCRDGKFDPIKQWQQSLHYSVTNVEYLAMTHQLWMNAHLTN